MRSFGPEEAQVAGHSLWFREFFKSFLPKSCSHTAKTAKMVNCGAWSLVEEPLSCLRWWRLTCIAPCCTVRRSFEAWSCREVGKNSLGIPAESIKERVEWCGAFEQEIYGGFEGKGKKKKAIF